MKNISSQIKRSDTSLSNEKFTQTEMPRYNVSSNTHGLADLQRNTTNALSQATQWGFSDVDLKVKRHKLDNHTWQLTVVNPKTRKTILQAEGHGDTVFAHEESLARMAETLIAQGLTIRTNFDD